MNHVRSNAVALAPALRAGVLGLVLALVGPVTAVADWTVEDVALRPGGVLDGRISTLHAPPTAQRVWLLCAGQTVAEAGVDTHGCFMLQRLSPGCVEIVYGTDEPVGGGRLRLWAAGTAPPGAADTVRLTESEPIVRGQGRFPVMGFPRAASIASIAAGAVAVPVIHHNIQQSHKAPHSP